VFQKSRHETSSGRGKSRQNGNRDTLAWTLIPGQGSNWELQRRPVDPVHLIVMHGLDPRVHRFAKSIQGRRLTVKLAGDAWMDR
jgi:hypothetical protein